MARADDPSRPRLLGLLRRVPELISRLIREEVASATAELKQKAKAARLGAGLTAGGVVLALFGVGALVTAAIAALTLVLPEWASALIVAGALLLIAGILVWVGVAALKRALPPVPVETIESVKADVRVVTGVVPR